LGFGKSDNLAAAYGIAVSLTMLMTSALLFIAMREIWGWGFLAAGAIAGLFLIVDAAFFAANLAKVFEGGYVPLLLAGAVYGVMWIWHRGAAAVHARIMESSVPIGPFLAKVESGAIPRVPGAAVFFTRSPEGVPPVMMWHVKHNRALHEFVLVLRLSTAPTPRVAEKERLTLTRTEPNFWRAEAQFGFMELLDIPKLLRDAKAMGCGINLDDVTYYVGHETVVARDDRLGLPHWQEAAFSVMERNASRMSDFLRLPTDQLVEVGRQIAI
jgi:KUP system potassium uptake protein